MKAWCVDLEKRFSLDSAYIREKYSCKLPYRTNSAFYGFFDGTRFWRTDSRSVGILSFPICSQNVFVFDIKQSNIMKEITKAICGIKTVWFVIQTFFCNEEN